MVMQARIHSLNGEFDKVEILSEHGFNDVVVLYSGIKCTAIFNPFAGCYYVDDIYGQITQEDK